MQQKQLLPRQRLTRLFEQNIARALGLQATAFCENDTDYDPMKTCRVCGDTNTEDQRSRCICFKACGKGLLTFTVWKDIVLSSPCLRFLKTIPAIFISKVGRRQESLGFCQCLSRILYRFISTLENARLVYRGWSVIPTDLKNTKSSGYLHPKHSLLKVTIYQPWAVLRSSPSL